MNHLPNDAGRADHIREAHQLTQQGYIRLLHLRLFPAGAAEVNIYLSPDIRREWRGMVFEAVPWHISGDLVSSDGEVGRPTLSIYNKDNIFTRYAVSGYVEGAEVTLYRVLKSHFDDGINSYLRRVWLASHVSSVQKGRLSVSLRGALDTPKFIMPQRQYISPDFPQVSL